ncbi:MAG: crossover junction endodeoxyribonuclease RuvC [Candidatus Campbellbacteria bacterium]|nr:crossover junction endodeoxyribonuclease RuvC [Candidatus Campbellbacteria bacterium]
MIVLGVDPGYDRAGFALVEESGGKFKLIHSECAETNSKDNFEKRLWEITDRYKKLIEKYKPDFCAIELLFVAKNKKTAMQVAEVRGALLYTTEDKKLKVLQFTPKEIKSMVCGDGSAEKQQIYKMVSLLIPTLPKGKKDDEYDAVAVSISGLLAKGGS